VDSSEFLQKIIPISYTRAMKIIRWIPMWLNVSLIVAIIGAIGMTIFIRSGKVITAFDGALWIHIRIMYVPLISFVAKMIAHLPRSYPEVAFQRIVGIATALYNFILFFIIGFYFYWFWRLYLNIKSRYVREDVTDNSL
jgi:hypothetical protein